MTDFTKYTSKDELYDFLHANKSALIAEKKYEVKKADALHASVSYYHDKINSNKSLSTEELLRKDTLKAQLVINTTNILDSHSDVHINGLWNKSIKEQRNLYLLQEHKMSFDSIVSDKVKATSKVMSWDDLGFHFKGETEALIFNAEIDRKRNEFMFNQYANGWVKNHSVGMRYIQLFLAINSEETEYKEEKEVWDKYIKMIANKSDANDLGYFWAVTEAKLIEGSAVPLGSNWATPTREIKFEPSEDTQNNNSEPVAPLTKGLFETLGSKIKN